MASLYNTGQPEGSGQYGCTILGLLVLPAHRMVWHTGPVGPVRDPRPSGPDLLMCSQSRFLHNVATLLTLPRGRSHHPKLDRMAGAIHGLLSALSGYSLTKVDWSNGIFAAPGHLCDPVWFWACGHLITKAPGMIAKLFGHLGFLTIGWLSIVGQSGLSGIAMCFRENVATLLVLRVRDRSPHPDLKTMAGAIRGRSLVCIT